jgi:ubiquitin-protein ligase
LCRYFSFLSFTFSGLPLFWAVLCFVSQTVEPMESEIARVWLQDRNQFDKNAKEWTRKYAM